MFHLHLCLKAFEKNNTKTVILKALLKLKHLGARKGKNKRAEKKELKKKKQ